MTPESPPSPAPAPQPHSERGAFIVAAALAAVGLAVLVFVLTGGWQALAPASLPAPPPIVVQVASGGTDGAPVAADPPVAARAAGATPIVGQPLGPVTVEPQPTTTHVPEAWEARFYPIYERASRTFDVNWLLLASIHKQETDFSTAPTTYHGLNFAHCCGGPMQFNVTNGPVTTWDLVRDAYRFAKRPSGYDHETTRHPSIYDDFDSIMAAGWLLYSDGASEALDGSAWDAAYDYYGHDEYGVTYADQVLARAIGWSERGFCINCGLDGRLVNEVYAAYGAPVLAQLEAEAAAAARARARAKRAAERRKAAERRRRAAARRRRRAASAEPSGSAGQPGAAAASSG